MKIALTGSSGLIGTALAPVLAARGHEVVPLVRRQPHAGSREVRWDPERDRLDEPGIKGCEAVVHLAGEGVASRRWSEKQKERIRRSRIDGTRLLAAVIGRMDGPPQVFVSASAIGYYGDRGDEVLTEESRGGSGFLADVAREWEEACEFARERGIRVVNLRFGVVLSAAGGALAKMLTPFKLGAGGVLGNGRQYMSWVAIDDAVGAIVHALEHDEVAGVVNVVAPQPATNREFTRTLGRVLGRPTLLPMPAVAARLAFGEMADELLLASARVRPVRLEATGYAFRFPELEGALRHVLGRPQAREAGA